MIDILLAAYNGEGFLKEQIESVLLQTCGGWRLLVRDDGSNDTTIDIVKDYAERFPERIKLISDNLGNLGVAQNFGRLLEVSDAEYIMFCDQDDVWLQGKIELTLQAMKEAGKKYPDTPLLVHTDLKIADANLNIAADSFWRYAKIEPETGGELRKIVYRNVVTGCTMMINRLAKRAAVPIPPEARIHDWWIAMNAAKYGKIVSVRSPTVLYRQHSGNVIGAAQRAMTISRFIEHTKKFSRKFLSDYRLVKMVYPRVNPILLLLSYLSQSINRRTRRIIKP
jgi:glycosyltransferase involved in cell wall biosynthesis